MTTDQQRHQELLDQVTAALSDVQDPCAMALKTDWSLIDLGLLVDAYDKDGELVVELTLTDPLCPFLELIDEMVVRAVSARTGYETVTLDISSEVAWDPSRLQREGSLTQSPAPR